jgi:hypothetical protein
MAPGRWGRHARRMAGLSRTLLRYGVPTALFLLGLALVIAERAVGIGWGVVVVALGWAAHGMNSRTAGSTRSCMRQIRRRPGAT